LAEIPGRIAQKRTTPKTDPKGMIQRILNSRNFVATLMAAATGMALYLRLPFPSDNVFLQLVALRAPLVHHGLFYSYNLFLFTTPYIGLRLLCTSPTTRKRSSRLPGSG
jgi:hypothetical protein